MSEIQSNGRLVEVIPGKMWHYQSSDEELKYFVVTDGNDWCDDTDIKGIFLSKNKEELEEKLLERTIISECSHGYSYEIAEFKPIQL